MRLKNLSRTGWFVVGAVVALVLVPTGAGAAAFFSIQGTVSGNKAEVTGANQLMVAAADPQNYLLKTAAVSGSVNDNTVNCTTLGTPSSGRAWVLTNVHYAANRVGVTGPPPGSGFVQLAIAPPGISCTNLFGSTAQSLAVALFTTAGNEDEALGSGVTVPPGYQLLFASENAGATFADVTGYTVAAAAVPATPASSTAALSPTKALSPLRP
jgi:hypothetical protein